jgi:hypothetical protein
MFLTVGISAFWGQAWYSYILATLPGLPPPEKTGKRQKTVRQSERHETCRHHYLSRHPIRLSFGSPPLFFLSFFRYCSISS